MAQLGQLFARFLSVSLLFIFPCLIGQASAETLTGTALIQHLRKGGYVLLMRHASSPSAPPGRKSADSENVALERQLDDTGRNSAIAMGRALKRLGIPVSTVLSSPTYRALETIRLASFGTPVTFSQLGDGGQSMLASAVSNQADWLRERASEPPALGSNTIIVTHMPNIVASFGNMARDLKDGETLVFKPHGRGNVQLVARVEIETWHLLSSRNCANVRSIVNAICLRH